MSTFLSLDDVLRRLISLDLFKFLVGLLSGTWMIFLLPGIGELDTILGLSR